MPLKGVVNRIIEGFMAARMTEDWRRALQKKPVEVWTEEICSLISPPIEHLLTAPSPPSLADMESFEWGDTDKMGVYGWALRPAQRSSGISYYLYVGSATGVGKGLTGRKREHEEERIPPN